MSMTIRRGRTVVSDINVTPMADIMIVLLIIFMVTVPIMRGPAVALPEARHARNSAKDKLDLVVTERGIRIGNDELVDDTLSAYLADRAQASPATISVVVQADRDATYGRVARVLQACRAAGIEEVGLATRPRVD
jgi:biopolymer transport protein ExbD